MRDDGQPSAAEILYGTPIRLPIDLLVPTTANVQYDPSDYCYLLKIHMQCVMPIVTTHNVATNKRTYEDPKQATTTKVWVRNMVKTGLQTIYKDLMR